MSRNEPLTLDQAHLVYDILSYLAGASDAGRDTFVDVQVNSAPDEYRFVGALDFGGKFWNCNGRWYVSAYPEDYLRDSDMERKVGATNDALAHVRTKAVG
jgi:hypothetical protein